MATAGCSSVSCRVASMPSMTVDGLPAVGGGRDDLDVGEEPEQQDEALADAGLVVGDHDPQRRRVVCHCGTCAVTTQLPSSGPAWSEPSIRSSRSCIPTSP